MAFRRLSFRMVIVIDVTDNGCVVRLSFRMGRQIPRVDVNDGDDAVDDPRRRELNEQQARAELASDVEGAPYL